MRERTRIGRAAAGRNPGRRGRSDRGRRLHGRDRGLRPCGRRRPFAFDPARTTLRAGTTRRGLLGRAHGGPDRPAARDRSLCRGMGAHARPPRRGAGRAHRDRDTANAGAPHDGRARRSARSRWRRRNSAASHWRSTASNAPTGSASSASRRRPMPPHAHAGAAARAASMTHAERVETVRRAMEGQFFPGRTDPPPAAFGWAAGPAEDAPVSPPEPAPDLACRRPSREFTCHSAGAGARFACRRRGAGRWRCAGCMRRARFMGCAQGAGCRTETAGGGRPTLADRPSLLPRGMERARVRPGGLLGLLSPPPPVPLPRRRRGNADGAARYSLSAPGGGEGRGEVGVFALLSSAPATFQARATGASFASCSARSSGPMRARSSAALTGSRLATGPRARGIPLIPLNPT